MKIPFPGALHVQERSIFVHINAQPQAGRIVEIGSVKELSRMYPSCEPAPFESSKTRFGCSKREIDTRKSERNL
jgi:hypothetical protein